MASSVLVKIEEAAQVLRAAVASLDPGMVSGADAEQLIRAFAAVSKTADAGVAKLARRLDDTARWKAAGSPSAEAHLGTLTGSSIPDGRRLLDTSRRLDELPATREAMERGELSVDQAAQVTTAAGELADRGRTTEAATVEAELLAVAGRGNFGSLRTAAEQARQAARDEAAQREHLRKTRFFRKRRFDDGGLGGTFKLEPTIAAQVYAVLDAEADRQFRIARSEGRREGHDAYAADALVDVVQRSATARPVSATHSDTPHARRDSAHADPSAATSTPHAPHAPDAPAAPMPPPHSPVRAEVIVRVDLAALYRGRSMAGELCEIAGVGPVPVAAVRDLLGEALVTLVLHDGVDIINVTCGGRRAAKALRTAVLERDGHVCDTCASPYGLEFDHTQPYALSERTTYAELRPKCRRCHGNKTKAEAAITIRAGRERALVERRTRDRINRLVAVHSGRAGPHDVGHRALPATGTDPPDSS